MCNARCWSAITAGRCVDHRPFILATGGGASAPLPAFSRLHLCARLVAPIDGLDLNGSGAISGTGHGGGADTSLRIRCSNGGTGISSSNRSGSSIGGRRSGCRIGMRSLAVLDSPSLVTLAPLLHNRLASRVTPVHCLDARCSLSITMTSRTVCIDVCIAIGGRVSVGTLSVRLRLSVGMSVACSRSFGLYTGLWLRFTRSRPCLAGRVAAIDGLNANRRRRIVAAAICR